MKTRLTQTVVDKATADKGQNVNIWDSQTPGLYLRVRGNSTGVSKVYYLFCRIKGWAKNIKLGTPQYLSVAQAREAAISKLAAAATGGFDSEEERAPCDQMQVTDYLEKKYFPWLVVRNRNSAQIIRDMLNFVKPFAALRVNQVDANVVNKRTDEFLHRENPLKAATANRRLSAYRGALNWGVGEKLLSKNFCDGAKWHAITDSEEIIRYLVGEEEARFWKTLQLRNEQKLKKRCSKGPYADSFLPAVTLAMKTGIRRRALFLLEWRDVNFQARVIAVRAANSKTKKTQRIPLSDATCEMLSNWRRQNPDVTLLFPRLSNDVPYDTMDFWWKPFKAAAQIQNFRWHDMRHHFASKLVMAGIPLNTVRELLGHSDLKMTLRYAHLAPETLAKAIDVLG